ncbi:hypothetical protein [Pacificispira sp.]|uniref:hypothetical protein n=1 Tax=Pacificispira sp. TaxID=2888761 RepID=UPI003BAA47EB
MSGFYGKPWGCSSLQVPAAQHASGARPSDRIDRAVADPSLVAETRWLWNGCDFSFSGEIKQEICKIMEMNDVTREAEEFRMTVG